MPRSRWGACIKYLARPPYFSLHSFATLLWRGNFTAPHPLLVSLDKRLGRRLNPLVESKFPPYPRDTCYISADTRCIFWVAVRIPSPRLLAPVNCQRYARYRIHGVVLSPATPSATANFFPLCRGGIFRGKPTIRLLSICWHVKGRWSSGVAEIQGKRGCGV